MNKHVLFAAAIATLTLAGCASTSPSYGTSDPYNNNYPPPANATCYDCGTVTRIDTVGGQPRRMSSSGGLAIYLPRAGIDSQVLLSRADQAMYASKRAGKGRATEWHAGLPPVSANAG